MAPVPGSSRQFQAVPGSSRQHRHLLLHLLHGILLSLFLVGIFPCNSRTLCQTFRLTVPGCARMCQDVPRAPEEKPLHRLLPWLHIASKSLVFLRHHTFAKPPCQTAQAPAQNHGNKADFSCTVGKVFWIHMARCVLRCSEGFWI